MSVNEKMTAIADAIRDATGTIEKLTLDDMADSIAGIADAAKQAQYDTFWDMFQQKGNRTDYRSAFAYTPWDDTNFNPKYPIKIVGEATSVFVGTVFVWADKVLRVDLSKATYMSWTFRNNKFTRFGRCDLSSATFLGGSFSLLDNLVEIEEIVSRADLPWNNTFAACPKLESVKFSGVIGSNGLSFADSPKLNKASITSIINALSTTTSGLSITLSETAVNNAFASGDTLGMDSAEWGELIDTKSNWTISVV